MNWAIPRERCSNRAGACVNASFLPYAKRAPERMRSANSESDFTTYGVPEGPLMRKEADHRPYPYDNSACKTTLSGGVSSACSSSVRFMNSVMHEEDCAVRCA